MYNKQYEAHVMYNILFTEGPEGDPLKRGLGNRAIYHMYNKQYEAHVMYNILFTEGPEGDPSQTGTWEQGYHMYNKCMKHMSC